MPQLARLLRGAMLAVWGVSATGRLGAWPQLGDAAGTLVPSGSSRDDDGSTSSNTLSRFAWVSTLCGDSKYVPAIAVLGHSLQRANTTHDMVLLVTGKVAKERASLAQLQQIGWKMHFVDPIVDSPFGHNSTRYLCFSMKLSAFDLVEYEKIVLLDADTAVMQNADDLFEQYPREPSAIAAAPNNRYPAVEVNSGVLVLKPSRETARGLVDHVRSGAVTEWDGADQGLINQFFFGKIDYLPPFYNVMNTDLDSYTMNWLLRQHPTAIKIVHYVSNKPIFCGRDTHCIEGSGEVPSPFTISYHDHWWRLYDSMAWQPRIVDVFGRTYGQVANSTIEATAPATLKFNFSIGKKRR